MDYQTEPQAMSEAWMFLPSTWLRVYVFLIDQSLLVLEDAAEVARRWGL
jgi:hypothetical protein